MNKILRINYTFNYDGSPSSSFNNAFEGLLKILRESNAEIPLKIIFPLSTALSEEQKELIDESLLKYKQESIFRKNIRKQVI